MNSSCRGGGRLSSGVGGFEQVFNLGERGRCAVFHTADAAHREHKGIKFQRDFSAAVENVAGLSVYGQTVCVTAVFFAVFAYDVIDLLVIVRHIELLARESPAVFVIP